MKSLSSKDGKMHGNVQTVGRYEESKGKANKQPASESGGESGGEHEPMQMDQVKQVAMEHGPASKVEITHGEGGEGGDHHVTSTHEDGHKHSSSHGSASEAHAAAAHLCGATDTNELMEAHGGQQEQDTLAEAGHRDNIERNSHKMHKGGGFMPEHDNA
jgi:hypothetical protein